MHDREKSPSAPRMARPATQHAEIHHLSAVQARGAPGAGFASRPLAPGSVLQMQRTLGNRATIQGLARQAANEAAGGDHAPAGGGGVVQRMIEDYKQGTLAITTRVMRDLTDDQRKIVQELHDDEENEYTIEEAREIAIGPQSTSQPNPYDWDVTGIDQYTTTNPDLQNVLTHFGHPTQQVVKTYDELARRVQYGVGKDKKGSLTPQTKTNLRQQFQATKPLHLGFNDFLNTAWEEEQDDYKGKKSGISLYGALRTRVGGKFREEPVENENLNDVLKEVSGRPFELHHVLFKARHPEYATDPRNLMLTERSEKESVYGPGQHELMHMVASGNDKNKYVVLLPQVVQEYKDFLKDEGKPL